MQVFITLKLVILNCLFWSSHSNLSVEQIGILKEIRNLGQIDSKLKYLETLSKNDEDYEYLKMETLNEALELFEMVYEKRVHFYNSAFSTLLPIQFGTIEKSCTFLEGFLDLVNEQYGPNQIKSLALLSTLGNIYLEQNQYIRAKQYFVKSLKIQDLTDLKKAPILKKLAKIHEFNGEFKKALVNYEQTLEIYQKYQDLHEEDILVTISDLGTISGKIGDQKNALKYHRICLQRSVEKYGKDDIQTVTQMSNVALVYLDMKNYSESLELLEEVLEIEKKYDTADVSLATTYYNLGRVLSELNDLNHEVLENLEISLNLFNDILGENSLESTYPINSIARIYILKGDYKKALEYYNLVLNILNINHGEGHFQSAPIIGNIASVYQELGIFDKAIEMYESQLSILDKYSAEDGQLGSENLNYVTTALFQLGILYYGQGEFENSATHFERCLELLETYELEDCETNSKYMGTLKHLEIIYEHLGHFEKAARVINKINNSTDKNQKFEL